MGRLLPLIAKQARCPSRNVIQCRINARALAYRPENYATHVEVTTGVAACRRLGLAAAVIVVQRAPRRTDTGWGTLAGGPKRHGSDTLHALAIVRPDLGYRQVAPILIGRQSTHVHWCQHLCRVPAAMVMVRGAISNCTPHRRTVSDTRGSIDSALARRATMVMARVRNEAPLANYSKREQSK